MRLYWEEDNKGLITQVLYAKLERFLARSRKDKSQEPEVSRIVKSRH